MSAVIARAAVVPMCAEPSLRAEQTNQLVLGETAAVLETAGDWRKVRTELDSYIGWVHAGYGAEVTDAEAEAWRSQATAWSLGAAARVGELRVRLPLRARVVLEGDTVRLPDGRRARVVEGTVAPIDQAAPAARAKA
ncbi:MAG TPA: SH3 domain-containing protein, partial [Gemmatimonadales bacterium]|nr:SH3 domain-containing protein [Gemmatimonadales bacterium]